MNLYELLEDNFLSNWGLEDEEVNNFDPLDRPKDKSRVVKPVDVRSIDKAMNDLINSYLMLERYKDSISPEDKRRVEMIGQYLKDLI